MAGFCGSLGARARTGSTDGCGFAMSPPEHVSLMAVPQLIDGPLGGKCWSAGTSGLAAPGFSSATHSWLPSLDVVAVNLQLNILQATPVALLGHQWKLDG